MERPASEFTVKKVHTRDLELLVPADRIEKCDGLFSVPSNSAGLTTEATIRSLSENVAINKDAAGPHGCSCVWVQIIIL